MTPPDQGKKELLEEELRVVREEIELLDEEGELLEEEIERELRHEQPRYRVICDNQDDGATAHIRIAPHRTVGDAITKVYEKFHAERRPGDRLVRVSDGKDVFPESTKTIEQYIGDLTPKLALHWSYRADTGGASA